MTFPNGESPLGGVGNFFFSETNDRLVGWILTLRKLGDIFSISGFHTWNLVMTVLMVSTWVILFILTALAFWEGKIFISSSEAVIQDSYTIHASEKQRERDPELGVQSDGAQEMSYVPHANQPRSFFEESPVVSSRASTATAH